MSQQKQNFLFSIQLIAFLFIINLLLLNPIDDAFSDGLFEEKLPPALLVIEKLVSILKLIPRF